MFPLEANDGLTGKDRRSGSCDTPGDVAAILSPGMIDVGKSYLNVLFPAFVGGVEDPMTAVCLAPDLPCAASSLAAVCPPVGSIGNKGSTTRFGTIPLSTGPMCSLADERRLPDCYGCSRSAFGSRD